MKKKRGSYAKGRYIKIFQRNINNNTIKILFNPKTEHSYFLSSYYNIKYSKKHSKKWREEHQEEQRMWNKTRKGLESHRKAKSKWYYKNPFKDRQKSKLNKLFQHGDISNDEFECAICGKQPVEKHHENYDLWNVFIPLCPKHHRELNLKKENIK